MKLIWSLLLFGVMLGAKTTPSLSMQTYKKLSTMELLREKEEDIEAQAYLIELLNFLPESSIDKAYIFYTAGIFYLQKEKYIKAKSYFLQAYNKNILPLKSTQQILKILGNLASHEEDYFEASQYYKKYLKITPDASQQIYTSLAVSYYYQEDYKNTILIIQEANKKFKPNQTLYKILFSSYYELKEIPKAIVTLEMMITFWSKKSEYWLQLSSIYLEEGNHLKALETMQLAYTNKLLHKEDDLMRYMYLLIEVGIPYKAATMLEMFIKEEKVISTEKKQKLVQECYLHARKSKHELN